METIKHNVFKNAYFDKKYRTRDGRMAIYHTLVNERPQCLVKDVGLFIYAFNGVNVDAGIENFYNHGVFPQNLDYELNEYSYLDIVSEWEE